jgi:ribose/xylose/arabinose/galactoside ABC-type transport system permease subunit
LSVTTATAKRERRSWVGDSPAVPPLVTLLALFLIFSIAVPHFGTMRTVSGIIGAGSINALVVIGVTMLMICGEFDLSVGSMMAG